MWIVHYMRWIMLLSGVLRATMGQAAITPDDALQRTSGRWRVALWYSSWSQLGNARCLSRRDVALCSLQPAATVSSADRRGREQGYLHLDQPPRDRNSGLKNRLQGCIPT
jgi:hypothetical protein